MFEAGILHLIDCSSRRTKGPPSLRRARRRRLRPITQSGELPLHQPSTVSTFLSCTCGLAILSTASTAVSGEPTAHTRSPSFGARGQVVLDELLKASTDNPDPMLLGLGAVEPSGWASVWRTSSEDNVGYWN